MSCSLGGDLSLRKVGERGAEFAKSRRAGCCAEQDDGWARVKVRVECASGLRVCVNEMLLLSSFNYGCCLGG